MFVTAALLCHGRSNTNNHRRQFRAYAGVKEIIAAKTEYGGVPHWAKVRCALLYPPAPMPVTLLLLRSIASRPNKSYRKALCGALTCY
jgi:hypothetical protein